MVQHPNLKNIATGGLAGTAKDLGGFNPANALTGGIAGMAGKMFGGRGQYERYNGPQQNQQGFQNMAQGAGNMAGMLSNQYGGGMVKPQQQQAQVQPQQQAQLVPQQQAQPAPQPAAQPKMGYEEWKAKGRPNVPHEG